MWLETKGCPCNAEENGPHIPYEYERCGAKTVAEVTPNEYGMDPFEACEAHARSLRVDGYAVAYFDDRDATEEAAS